MKQKMPKNLKWGLIIIIISGTIIFIIGLTFYVVPSAKCLYYLSLNPLILYEMPSYEYELYRLSPILTEIVAPLIIFIGLGIILYIYKMTSNPFR